MEGELEDDADAVGTGATECSGRDQTMFLCVAVAKNGVGGLTWEW